MIDSLQLKNIATYDRTGILIKDLKKINFIYGVNGSGKTTLTKLVSSPKDALFSNCSVVWKNNLPLKALVYNKEFRDKNFGQGKIDGVFISIQFPTIFSLGIEKLGDFTEKGSALMNIAIVGGAVFPPLQGIIADRLGLQISYLVPAFCFILIVMYGWFCAKKGPIIRSVSQLDPAFQP